MQKMFSAKRVGFRPNNLMLYPERDGSAGNSDTRAGMGVCGWCGAVHFAKAWHHPDAARKKLGKNLRSAWLGRCPACEMVAEGRYEGEVLLTGIPPETAPAVANLIRAFMHRAYARDCQHRLIALHRESDSTWRVTVTENQLASGLSRRIRETFKDATPKVSFPHGPGNVRLVRIAFHPVPAGRITGETHSRLLAVLRTANGLTVPA